jgi:hypothetical protein
MMTSILKKTLIAGLAAATMAGALAATPASARDGRHGAFFGGLVAGGLLGGALSQGYYGPRYYGGGPAYVGGYDDAPDCWIERRPLYDSWGEVVSYRRVRICN